MSEAALASLVQLNLASNNIGPEGMLAFLPSKERFPALALLTFGYKTDDDAAAALFRALGPVFLGVSINGNILGDFPPYR